MGGSQVLERLQSVVILASHRHYQPQQARMVGQGTRLGGGVDLCREPRSGERSELLG